MRIAITGATGLLGRNLLFEILKQNINNLNDLEIFIFGRDQKAASLEERIKNIVLEDGSHYIGVNSQNKSNLLNEIDRHLHTISFDLTKDDLGISHTDFKELKKDKIEYFFHLASLSDFRQDKQTKLKLENVNIQGTNRLLKLINELQVYQAVYTGSAYSCGEKTQKVDPDYINLDERFRNYYEKSKLIAEINFRNFCSKQKIKYKIFRPVGICGRLIENPIGSINKFHDLFYGWAAFFLREKINAYGSLENIYKKPFKVSMRLSCNPNAGLNLVPADYAAKVMLASCVYDDPGISYHISNNTDIPHKTYLPLILRELNVLGCKFVENEPANKNNLERLYYKTLGKIYNPYLTLDSCNFINSNLSGLLKKIRLNCPPINEDNFMKLIKFAKDRYFGLSLTKSGG